MSLTYMLLRENGTEAKPFEYYAGAACVAAGCLGVGRETVVGANLAFSEQSYIPVLGNGIDVQSINSETYHSDDLYVILHGFYPDADEMLFDITIGDMPQPWKTIFSMLTDWTNLAGIDLHLGELTYIQHNLVVMQVTGLAPALRRAITTTTLGVAK